MSKLSKSARAHWAEVKVEFKIKIQAEMQIRPLFCPLCGGRIHNINEVSLDHIKPRNDGGEDEVYNIQQSHALCNNRRGHSKLKREEYFDKNIKANCVKYSYTDIYRTKWTIRFRRYTNNPIIEVKVYSKMSSGQSIKSETRYDLSGNRIDDKKKQNCYRTNAVFYTQRGKKHGNHR